MARTPLLSTRVLLVCAAIGVATGIVGGIAGSLSLVVLATAPFLYGMLLGAHVLPGIIAQEVLRLPLVALITHVLAALVASAFAPMWIGRFLGTALLFGAIQEAVAAATRYRAWGPWRFFISAGIIGVIIAVVVFFAAHVFAVAIGSLAGAEEHGRHGLVSATRHGVSESIGMLVVSIPPIGLLLLGVAGILRHDDAVWLALAVDAVLLGILGWVIAARRSLRFWVRLSGAALTAAFGGVLILLKAFVHH